MFFFIVFLYVFETLTYNVAGLWAVAPIIRKMLELTLNRDQ